MHKQIMKRQLEEGGFGSVVDYQKMVQGAIAVKTKTSGLNKMLLSNHDTSSPKELRPTDSSHFRDNIFGSAVDPNVLTPK